MATRDEMVGHDWVQLTTDATQTSIECISGYGVLRGASTSPAITEYRGHRLSVGDFFVVTEPVFARTTSSGWLILVVS